MSKHDKTDNRRYQLECSGYSKAADAFGGLTTKGTSRVIVARDNFVRYGDDLPNWREIIAYGGNATTSMVGVRTASKPGITGCFWRGKDSSPLTKGAQGSWDGHDLNQFQDCPSSVSADFDPEAYNKAATALLGSYQAAVNTWRGGNFIAEFGETVEMLAHPIRSFYDRTWTFVGRVGRLRKVWRINPLRYGRLLGSLWLAYVFGIRPLLSDIADADAAVRRLGADLGRHDTYPLIGNGRVTSLLSQRLNGVIPAPTGLPSYTIRDSFVSRESSVRFKGAVIAKPPGWRPVADNFGVGFYDIVPAVWEAIPFSFLVDYFVNVAEVLDSYRLADAHFSRLQRTVRNSVVVNLGSARPNPSSVSQFDIVPSGGGGRVRITSVTRFKSSVPYSDFQFRVPGLSSLKWLNVAALVAQIAGSRPPSGRSLAGRFVS